MPLRVYESTVLGNGDGCNNRRYWNFTHACTAAEVIALNDADAYATSGAYFCVNSYAPRRVSNGILIAPRAW